MNILIDVGIVVIASAITTKNSLLNSEIVTKSMVAELCREQGIKLDVS